ncbi:fungal-specific transcription factor domain-containing protein [Fomitopsis serialis]|uniref:fungal-specific transcription factor domain-containing protein n=1 Tax=Fomitopsis serialis TaxID=139415 RepID=UPI00200870DF|nr:fungal-specific transcription factor domain-containing protein [Neoantrodia serialis]KAH9925558.1 fungal-specific transcription factor domain-containing protein [Neoantrodia serialis]
MASRTKKELSTSPTPREAASPEESSKVKRKRQSQSCDACRARKVRCARENPDDPKTSCKHCIALNIPCTYDYQPKKRGPPNLLQEAAAAQAAAAQQHAEASGSDMSQSPASTSHAATSPTHALSPSVPGAISFLDQSLASVPTMASTALTPSRYPITADGFTSHYNPMPSLGTAYTAAREEYVPPQDHDDTPLSYYYRAHRLEDVAPRDTILLILALFFDFVYPLTPCIHKQSFMADIHSRREERDPLFFALVMSTVAATLVQVPRSYLPMDRHAVRKLAQTCHEASRHISVASYDPPTSMHVVVRYFDTVYHFCEGHDATQHAAFGEAAHIAITLRMHEESSYEGLDLIECEVRRRTFWLLFGADKSMSILLGRPISLRDEDTTCNFPRELDDEYITHSAYLPQPHGKTAIVSGLNYISRIFALLGEILVRIRVDKRSPPQGQFLTARLEEPELPSPELGGPNFRQTTLGEVKDFFDNPNASRANALNPFLVMQANVYVTQQLVRFVIEQYRDELITSLQGNIDEQRVAEEREAVASELLNILHRSVVLRPSVPGLVATASLTYGSLTTPGSHSIPIQSIATNGPSLVHKVRFVASTLLDAVRKAETAPASAARAHAYLWDFLSILSEIERNYLLDDEPRDPGASADALPLLGS